MSTTSLDHPERRIQRRGRVLKAGKIVFNSNQSVIDCVIRDLSPGGARVQLTQAGEIPDAFGLFVVNAGVIYPASILWRSRTEHGVIFTGPSRKPRTTS